MARIRLDGVSKRFGTTPVVQEVNLDIADGEFLVLLGPSGCGKSTLLRMIAGLESLSAGRILLDDRDITATAPRQRDVAMVFQSYALYPHLTVAKNIGFPLRARGRSRQQIREKVTAVATTLGLDEHLDRRPGALSGGQRQRVALARAMVRDPGAFLMDEPLSNLDAALRSATRTELIDLHHRLRSTFLYVTHDQVEAMTMATRIALLNNGRIEQVGTPTELYDTPRSTFVAAFLGAPPMNLFDATVIDRAGELHLVADGVDAPLGLSPGSATGPQKVTAGIRPEHIRLNAADAQLRGLVTASENLGSEEILHVTVGGTVIRVRGPRPVPAQVGDAAALSVDPADIQLFDSGTGRRLVWHVPHRHGASPRDAPLSVA
ncbi:MULTISPECIES: ABC transporter ATP-binding protein [Rhodococcus]|uniref:ABC transporter ATP-binding protein n=1 Tax=Rhodococcus TaxID=1827 RepID=UPI0029551A7E|nr:MULTISPECIES: ABC transporter ATP-binding protein [Rhodococcus]MDV7246734.1 ABC transporter ATP-binding protein [Rhodococcus oxybenzonivorans]MDV7337747.1 ABC transporter ATP-binding protein [Rhodococcus oxybenzonivorans]MDV7347803.1 ABC transporter ATP-binding protein [Rhodococcus oxybenzonivorans]MDV8031511.1 ABC transporter ATP-binding protein [Rhodococcus sp. IEGM 27]